MQTEMDGMQLEMRKKDSEVSVVNVEKDKILERLQDEEGQFYHKMQAQVLQSFLIQDFC